MYICVYIYIHLDVYLVYIYIYLYIYIYIYMIYIHIYIYIFAFTSYCHMCLNSVFTSYSLVTYNLYSLYAMVKGPLVKMP